MKFEPSEEEYNNWKAWLDEHELLSEKQINAAVELSKKIQPCGWLPQLYLENEFITDKEESVLCLSWFGRNHVMLNIEIASDGSYNWDYYKPSEIPLEFVVNNGSMTMSNPTGEFTDENLTIIRDTLLPEIRHGKIELWDERHQLDTLYDRQKKGFPDDAFVFADGRTAGQIRKELMILDLSLPTAAKDVAKVVTIGKDTRLNTSWVCPETCSVCELSTYRMIRFTSSDGEDKTFVCSACIKKANNELDNN